MFNSTPHTRARHEWQRIGGNKAMDNKMDIDEGNLSLEARPKKNNLPVESLVAGRERRSTAGNRLAALLDQAEADDIDLLFEENEDDVDFEAKDEEDIELGSSSDEEDGQGADDDELIGEKELDRETRAQRNKSRKTKDAFPGQQQLKRLLEKQDVRPTRQKRVTIQDPTSSTQTQTPDENTPGLGILDDRLRKKSERISWIPAPVDKPARQSARRQTVANKKVTHQRLKEAEERRIKTITAMNEALSRKKKDDKIVWTQKMRLEEAKRTEAKNLKSLNKWEEMEAVRVEAQRAKLAALHNRRLEGPVITTYSTVADWDEHGKLVRVGRRDLIQPLEEGGPKDKEKKKYERKKKDGEKASKEAEEWSSEHPMVPSPKENNKEIDPTVEAQTIDTLVELSPTALEDQAEPTSLLLPPEKTNEHDIRPLESTDVSMVDAISDEVPSQDVLQVLDGIQYYANTPTAGTVSPTALQQSVNNIPIFVDARDQVDNINTVPPRLKTPEHSTRTLLVLENFGDDTLAGRDSLTRVLFIHNRGAPSKPDKPLCVISSLPARFLDPSTGLPYANLAAYKQIQRVKAGEVAWSDSFQCFIGKPGEAAAGVPDGFL